MTVTSKLYRNPGFGLGLRAPHFHDFLSRPQAVDWLEIISDNFMVEGGRPWAVLDRLRQDYPVVMHGVAMSLASDSGPDIDYLRRLKQLADRIQPLWVSDHLCWTGWGGTRLHDLNPTPYTPKSARQVISAIGRAQDVLGRRLVLENVSSYVQFSGSACTEWEFLCHVAEQADCLLLLDVNNVYVSSVNHGFDPMNYLRAMPAGRIQQIHLAGHTQRGDVIIDTHDHPICPEVWALYAQACELWGPVATLIERDDHIPALGELVAELNTAREISNQAKAKFCPTGLHAASCRLDSSWVLPTESESPQTLSICDIQSCWVSSILSQPLADDAPVLNCLAPGHHFEVYHQAYQARLAECLADTFAKTLLYMGSDLFDIHARQFALNAPSQMDNLNDYGEHFPQALTQAYPSHPELCELAQLEWHLRLVFGVAHESPLRQSDLAQDPDLKWLHRPDPLLKHVRWMPITHSVAQIWNAIHQDQDVPKVQPLSEPTQLWVWRKGEQPHFISLSGVESVLMSDMRAGHSIAQACERSQDLLARTESDFLTQCLQRWLSLELLRKPVEPDAG